MTALRSLSLASSVALLALACHSSSKLSVEEASRPASAGESQSGYRTPPEDVVAIVDAPPTPRTSLSPNGERMLLMHRSALPSIAELAEPMLRLAGVRIHPARNARQSTRHETGYEVLRVADGMRVTIETPEDAWLGSAQWSPDGTRFLFQASFADGVELWVADAERGTSRQLVGRRLNATGFGAAGWWSGSESVLVRLVPEDRGPAPVRSAVPDGPIVHETSGRVAQNRTYQDLLADPHDEALFEHYFTAQLARVDLDGGLTELGAAGIFRSASPSPSGEFLLVDVLERPWSYTVPLYSFAHRVEVWDASGARVHTIAELPVADEVPIGGVPTGPRSVGWQPVEEATLVWVEAQDGGDPKAEVSHRDRMFGLRAPFDAAPTPMCATVHRYRGASWTDLPGVALVGEYDRDRRWTTTRLRSPWDAADEGRVLFDRSTSDRYGDPGSPVTHQLPDGDRLVLVEDGRIWLDGAGAGPDGERPFLDRMTLSDETTERVFRSPAEAHTSFVAFGPRAADGRRTMVLRRESPVEPPNYFRSDADARELVALTEFPDPHPQLTGISKELLVYERADGVPLSGTLYLPPGHQPGERLPLFVWAYPREYTDVRLAGQVRTTTNRFTRLSGSSPLMMLTQGYAVLDGAAMPVVGDPETMNETFVEQIVGAAQAAIDACAERGVADPQRVAAGGHSYGAFMTANLLAHCDLFRAGIARSGAYNRSLTPFGFQSERRTIWEATETYVEVSPFFQADGIDEPLLLIHGQLDNNSGTFPIQSERLFHALEGLGGTARFVELPYESHGYAARESVLHVLAESIEWLDRYVKDAAVTVDG